MLKNDLVFFIVLLTSLFYITYIAHRIMSFMNSFENYIKATQKFLEFYLKLLQR